MHPNEEDHASQPFSDSDDRVKIAQALASGARDVALDRNPGFASIGARLIDGYDASVRLRFTLPDAMSRGDGIAAGGPLTSCLDTAMVVAVLAKLRQGQTCTSITFTVNMVRPAMVGDLYAEATLDKAGRTVCFASARLFDADQKLVATASSANAVINLNK
ncbi:PaaI family thioesterase [Croceicoccus hydrothermalis]|uniref:PaaI family thioesterase n=1 Tax=Croceicoccus hydrothermalis TaxID=2867964 RepID=UPI001EFBFF0F|nr:PaaI family thioesterase [Croceicoccus hydrothermalis]